MVFDDGQTVTASFHRDRSTISVLIDFFHSSYHNLRRTDWYTSTMLTSKIPKIRLLTSLARHQSSLGVVSRALRPTAVAHHFVVTERATTLRRFATSSSDDNEGTSGAKEEVSKETLEFQAETRQVRLSYSKRGSAIGESKPVLSHSCVETSSPLR